MSSLKLSNNAKSRQVGMKFVITGGHHNSALVVASELQKLGHEVIWIGHRHASAGDKNDSAEFVEVKAAGFAFHDLVAGKSSFELRNLFNLPLGLLRARKMMTRISPDAVISFGGYLGLSVSLVSYLLRIPVYLHEQTVIAGKANKIASRFAKKVYLTWDSSAGHYPSGKSVTVGLPLRESFKKITTKPLFSNSRPALLVIGGKQGSHRLNELIFAHLREILANYNLIHQTGTNSVTGDYDKAVALKEALPEEMSAGYDPRGYIAESDVAHFMRTADLVIGRSGAHTAYELAVLGKKCILIPLLSTHGREQLLNARLLEKNGLALILLQSELSYPRLASDIQKMLERKVESGLDLPLDASSRLISDMLMDLG